MRLDARKWCKSDFSEGAVMRCRQRMMVQSWGSRKIREGDDEGECHLRLIRGDGFACAVLAASTLLNGFGDRFGDRLGFSLRLTSAEFATAALLHRLRLRFRNGIGFSFASAVFAASRFSDRFGLGNRLGFSLASTIFATTTVHDRLGFRNRFLGGGMRTII